MPGTSLMRRDRQTTSLYRFYDASDALLYVGITNSLTRRLDQHHADKPWHENVARVTVEHHPDRGSALAAEKSAIQAEKPRHNIQHNHVQRATTPRTTVGRWEFSSRRSGHTRQVDLQLYPELDCSAMVDDYYYLDGEGQFEEYVQHIKRRKPAWWESNAIPIIWSVHSRWRGVYEAAPFTGDEPPWGDFLTHYTWPIDTHTGERLDWYQLPVVNDRFSEFAKALAWTPSALQPTCPLRSIVQSRSGYRPATRRYPTAA